MDLWIYGSGSSDPATAGGQQPSFRGRWAFLPPESGSIPANTRIRGQAGNLFRAGWGPICRAHLPALARERKPEVEGRQNFTNPRTWRGSARMLWRYAATASSYRRSLYSAVRRSTGRLASSQGRAVGGAAWAAAAALPAAAPSRDSERAARWCRMSGARSSFFSNKNTVRSRIDRQGQGSSPYSIWSGSARPQFACHSLPF